MNSDFSISVDDQAIATITWDCEKKSMNVLSFEALETLEKLIDQVINDEWIGAISMSSMTNMVLYGRVQESDEVFEQLIITKTDYFESLSDPDIVEMF